MAGPHVSSLSAPLPPHEVRPACVPLFEESVQVYDYVGWHGIVSRSVRLDSLAMKREESGLKSNHHRVKPHGGCLSWERGGWSPWRCIVDG